MQLSELEDGLYQVTSRRYRICAGFVIENGKVTMCAPILRRRLSYWATMAVRISK